MSLAGVERHNFFRGGMTLPTEGGALSKEPTNNLNRRPPPLQKADRSAQKRHRPALRKKRSKRAALAAALGVAVPASGLKGLLAAAGLVPGAGGSAGPPAAGGGRRGRGGRVGEEGKGRPEEVESSMPLRTNRSWQRFRSLERNKSGLDQSTSSLDLNRSFRSTDYNEGSTYNAWQPSFLRTEHEDKPVWEVQSGVDAKHNEYLINPTLLETTW